MWSVSGLLPRLVDPDAMELALRATVRGKRTRPDVAWLLFREEAVVERLCAELAGDRWQPQGFELVHIRDPKPRVIARAPSRIASCTPPWSTSSSPCCFAGCDPRALLVFPDGEPTARCCACKS